MTEEQIKQMADEHAEKLIKHKMATHDIFVKEKAKEEIMSVYIAGATEVTKVLQEQIEKMKELLNRYYMVCAEIPKEYRTMVFDSCMEDTRQLQKELAE